MLFKFFFEIKLLINIGFLLVVVNGNCSDLRTDANFNFFLWKSNQRSLKEKLFLNNVDSLEACKSLARKLRGLALNYSPKERFVRKHEDRINFRDHYWHQPHLYFNCHVLQCPESDTFKTMTNDKSFDYYSLYEKPLSPSDYICVPEVGIFKLNTIPETYQNATMKCRNSQKYYGTLAHVASQKRTEALTRLILRYNEQNVLKDNARVYLAYVGLQYNSTWSHNLDFFNNEEENLKCFTYRAWEPGSPHISLKFGSVSCVALTIRGGWKTVKCARKLPFICEIWTSFEHKG